ncbi:dehypoxanthine futalosine cyclase [Heliorestis acidaminivorans]|uniref:Cyclic dehypoxanthine futalosine synthase n=1 Tax=Heliorestis acidaminivorans TaxID=553427 RepID=A0A6I0EV03_9FIRM|nr:cyclic dehypoxanthinyl futalosine synthase [Heliorestis acidaminivorans]KAB2954605.1 dehypoxanthine futalosine cyclase [Heliorestis acidaminivorans]
MNRAINKIVEKVRQRQRLTFQEAQILWYECDLLTLGTLAQSVSKDLHGDDKVTFVIDRNINYTNVCTMGCRFCAFYKEPNSPGAYVLDEKEIFKKIEETIALGGTQILMQGGLHPELTLEYYLDLLRAIKERYKIHIHSFSPPEIVHIAEKSGLSIAKTIESLKEAGLDSIPGGGAEILDDRVRALISPRKIGWRQWMDVMQTAHRQGMKTTATMMFGSVETVEERIYHLERLREAQDETGGFTAFIPWSFQPDHTELGGMSATGVEYIRTLALSRVFLDNIPNIQASWVTQGSGMAQVALAFGANDFGGTMLEENVVRATGVTYRVPLDEIVHCIRTVGKEPVQRDTLYRALRAF